MNFFELHVGDYEAATVHLTMLEDAAYGRMLRLYYRTEKPLIDGKQLTKSMQAALRRGAVAKRLVGGVSLWSLPVDRAP